MGSNMLTNDSFFAALEERDRMTIATPTGRAASRWRERIIAALSFAALGGVVLGLLALRLWLSVPSWVHFAD
jgi:hypothetical protein